jgi:hypothetical protein
MMLIPKTSPKELHLRIATTITMHPTNPIGVSEISRLSYLFGRLPRNAAKLEAVAVSTTPRVAKNTFGRRKKHING